VPPVGCRQPCRDEHEAGRSKSKSGVALRPLARVMASRSHAKVSARSRPPKTFDLSLSEPAGSRSLNWPVRPAFVVRW